MKTIATVTITAMIAMGAVAALMVSVDGKSEEMPPPSRPCGQHCPPGHHATRPCREQGSSSDERASVERDGAADGSGCAPCPPRHYTQFWNSLEGCRYCGPPCKEGQRLVSECGPTHDRVCECEPGTFLLQEFCVQHQACPAGHGVTVKGSPNEDTRCAPCPHGYFSPEVSASAECRPHTNCSDQGSAELLPGASTHDALCLPCRQRREHTAPDRGDARPAGVDGAETPSSPEGPCDAATLQFTDSVRHLMPSCLLQHNILANPEKAAYIRKLLLRVMAREGQRRRHGHRKPEKKQRKRLEGQVKKLPLRVCGRTSLAAGSVRRSDSLRRKAKN